MMRKRTVGCALLMLAACQTGTKSSSPALPAGAPVDVPVGTPVDRMPLPEGEFSFGGGDGTSLDNAVVVTAPNETVGVAALYGWIGKHYPGAKAAGQSTVIRNGRYYDAIDIISGDIERRTLYFDITAFFGKF